MQILNQNIQWLMDNGSPAVQLRARKELIGEPPSQKMEKDLMEFTMAQLWLSRLKTPKDLDLNNLHSSKPECLENICGKLRELGITAAMIPSWKERISPFIDFLQNEQSQHGLNDFTHLFIYHPLITIGFDHPLIVEATISHLRQVASFCQKMNFDIYIDADTFGGLPAVYQHRKLLDPKKNHFLPTIWDIYALAYMPKKYRTPEIIQVEQSIINYILTDDYQHLPDGYGIMYNPPTHSYYAHGWNVNLPGWFGIHFERQFHEASFVQRIELMSGFPQTRTRKWFQKSVNHLESFQTERGTYRFPSTYLKEGTSGYYVNGAYMRLEENRRRNIALTLDSTFRMELIKKRISL